MRSIARPLNGNPTCPGKVGVYGLAANGRCRKRAEPGKATARLTKVNSFFGRARKVFFCRQPPCQRALFYAVRASPRIFSR